MVLATEANCRALLRVGHVVLACVGWSRRWPTRGRAAPSGGTIMNGFRVLFVFLNGGRWWPSQAPLLSPLRAVADLLVKSWAVMLVQLGAAAVVFARQKTGRSAAVSVPSHDGRDLLYHHVQQCGNGFPRAPRARPACFTAD